MARLALLALALALLAAPARAQDAPDTSSMLGELVGAEIRRQVMGAVPDELAGNPAVAQGLDLFLSSAGQEARRVMDAGGLRAYGQALFADPAYLGARQRFLEHVDPGNRPWAEHVVRATEILIQVALKPELAGSLAGEGLTEMRAVASGADKVKIGLPDWFGGASVARPYVNGLLQVTTRWPLKPYDWPAMATASDQLVLADADDQTVMRLIGLFRYAPGHEYGPSGAADTLARNIAGFRLPPGQNARVEDWRGHASVELSGQGAHAGVAIRVVELPEIGGALMFLVAHPDGVLPALAQRGRLEGQAAYAPPAR